MTIIINGDPHWTRKFTVDGLPGVYDMGLPTGQFDHLKYCLPDSSGIGYSSVKFVASIPRGNYASDGIPARANPEWANQIIDAIRADAEKRLS